MIHFLIGPPGAGKSYEAVVFHVLPALKLGRKVITNLPLDIEKLAAIEPGCANLIEIRTTPQPTRGTWDPGREGDAFRLTKTGHQVEITRRPFSGVWDFYSPWRHPETGIGPLYLVDECHLSMPRGGTDRHVEEWFSLHRHFKADVLLITQSYGKVSRDICDLVQIVYRCRKNIALGSPNSYVRKVQDGIRGEVVNTTIRSYEKRFFGLYRSHTQTGAAGAEALASDVRPIWRHWSVYGAAICFAGVAYAFATADMKNPLAPQSGKPVASTPQPKPAKPATAQETSAPVINAPQPASAPSQSAMPSEPFAGRGLHLTGHATIGARTIYTFTLSQNGQHIANLTDHDLQQAGYEWRPAGPCAGLALYGSSSRVIVCDAPQVGPGMVQAKEGGARSAGGPPQPKPYPAPAT